MALFKLQQDGLGIDLGTSYLVISDENGKILVNEPSVVAIDINNYDIVAVGAQAKSMIGKTPDNIVAISPIENGVIADFESTVSMLAYFIKKARPDFSLFQPDVCMCVSASLTDVERRSVEDLALNAGARSVKLIEENIASLKGIGVNVDEPTGHIILNVGAGTIEASVISLGGIVTSYCIKNGGENIDQDIKQILKKKFGVNIGISTAESIKIKIATLNSDRENNTMIVGGTDVISTMPKSVEIRAKDITPAIIPVVDMCIEALKKVLEKTPPDIANDIMKEGIYVVGGVSLIDYIHEYISNVLGMKVIRVDNPMECTGIGIGKFLKKGDKVRG